MQDLNLMIKNSEIKLIVLFKKDQFFLLNGISNLYGYLMPNPIYTYA